MEKLKKTMMIAFVVGIFLIPVVSIAGDLEPSAAPAPTMKTLDQIPPTWSQKLPAAQRFELVLDGAAVLDKETGLVWEKSPSTTKMNWYPATGGACLGRAVGGRLGWHLPTIHQLQSLVDISAASPPKLPTGHPFTNVQPDVYWSATTNTGTTTYAYGIDFLSGEVYYGLDKAADNNRYVWCVRGGQTYNAY